MPRPSAAPRFPIRSTRRSRPGVAIRAWSIGCRCSMTSSRRCSIICRDAPLSFDHFERGGAGSAPGRDRRILQRPHRGQDAGNFGAPPYNPLPPERLYLEPRGPVRQPAVAPGVPADPPSKCRQRRQPRSFRWAAGRGGVSPPSGPKRGATSIEAVRAPHRGAAQGRQAGADRRLDGRLARTAGDHPARP